MVDRLVARGYSVLQAEILIVFVPLGLARALLTRLKVGSPIRLPDTALIQDYSRNRMLPVVLKDIPEFVAARKLGEKTFSTGIIPREQFSAACQFSVEFNLINKMMNADAAPGGARMSESILLRLAEAPGFEEWYRTRKPRLWRRPAWLMKKKETLNE